MRRIKQCFCIVFPLLIIVLLSTCLVVWRLIKSFLESKMKKGEAEEVESPSMSIAGDEVSTGLASTVESEDKATGAEIEGESTKIASVDNKDISVGLVPTVEQEDQVTGAEIETNGTKAASVEDEDISAELVSTVEPEDKTMETTVEAEDDTVGHDVAEAYCVKCRQKRAIQGAREVTTKKGRSAIEGTCSVCGTKVFRFIARGKENLSEK
jgi:hypothetical protein